MIGSELWAEIMRLRHVEHLSHQQIAVRLGIHRQTVAAAVSSDVAPKYDRPERATVITPFMPAIKERLREFPEISAARLMGELKTAGYTGGYTAVKETVRKLRPPAVEAFLRRETEPGHEAQVDWGSFGTIAIDGYRRPLSCFVMVMGYSRMLYLWFTVSQRMEDFLRCHVDAFRFFGGIPHHILYDNLRSVVLARSGTTIRFHPRFAEFAGAHLFDPRPCGAYKPHEKGKVERSIRYIRENFFSGRSFRDLGDINAQAGKWRDDTANQRIHSVTRERPVDRMARDRTYLMALPERTFDTDIVIPVVASRMCLVRFDGNAYSVPFQDAGKSLLLRADPFFVSVFDKDRTLAKHRRSYSRHRVIEEPNHVRALLDRKRAARAVKAKDLLLALCPEGTPFLEGLLVTGRRLDAHLTRLAEMVSVYGRTAVAGAVAKACGMGLFGAGYVEQFLCGQSAVPFTGVSIPGHPEVEDTIILPHPLETYNGDPEDKDPPARDKRPHGPRHT
jgi:transposase